MDLKKVKGLIPGWYFARDIKSVWWNLFVYITSEPPFKCIRLTESQDSYVSPEEIQEVSSKRVSFEEFQVLQELQRVNFNR
jgi:hypothetical protein